MSIIVGGGEGDILMTGGAAGLGRIVGGGGIDCIAIAGGGGIGVTVVIPTLRGAKAGWRPGLKRRTDSIDL